MKLRFLIIVLTLFVSIKIISAASSFTNSTVQTIITQDLLALKEKFNSLYHICPKYSSYGTCLTRPACALNGQCGAGNACCKSSNGCYACISN